MRVISYGGGVQSTALLVLAAQGRIEPVDAALFANVGDDSEHPATLDYIRGVAKPYADANGIALHELRRTKRDGTVETLMGRITNPDRRAHVIPVRLDRSGKPGGRACTVDFKIKVVTRWLKQQGATNDNPAERLIGISTDEIQRVNKGKAEPGEVLVYPLIDLGLNRQDCMALIERAGLPVPPKSSCYFCPWHSAAAWRVMRRDEPELFEKSAQLEDYMRAKSIANGQGAVWLSDALIPLREAFTAAQDVLPFEGPKFGECDSGVCWV